MSDDENEVNYSGIINRGSTCYINSVLQCLRFTPSILDKMFDSEEHELDIKYLELINECSDDDIETNEEFKNYNIDVNRIKNLNVYFHYKQLLIQLIKSSNVIDAISLIQSCKNHIIQMDINLGDDIFMGQNDAQEFLVYLLDTIHESKGLPKKMPLKYPSLEACGNSIEKKIVFQAQQDMITHYSKSYSWIIESFYYQKMAIIKCNECSYFSTKIDNENHIIINIPQNVSNYNIYDCLDNYFGKETFDENNYWKCEKCKNEKGNYKQYRMMDCPDTLIIYFNRFERMGYTDIFRKITSLIDFPLTLNMNKYKLIDREKKSLYQLYGVVNQIGSRDSGHYYSFCKNIKSQTDTNWYVFNDERVTKINEANIVTDRAYILFYKKI